MNKNILTQFAKMIVLRYCPFKRLISSVMITRISDELERIYYKYATDEHVKTTFYKYNILENDENYVDGHDYNAVNNYDELKITLDINDITKNIMDILSNSDDVVYITNTAYIPLDIYKFLQLASFNYFKNNEHIHPLVVIRPQSKIWVDEPSKGLIFKIKKFDCNGEEKGNVDISFSTIEEIKETMVEGEEIHFILYNSVFVLVKDKEGFENIWFDKKEFNYFVDLAINDKDSEYMSKIIPYTTLHMINYLPEDRKNKVKKYIEMTNKKNILILSEKIPQDITRHIINKYITPDIIVIEKELEDKISSIITEIDKRMISEVSMLDLPFDHYTKKKIQNNIKYILNQLDIVDNILKDGFKFEMRKINKLKIITYLFEYLQYPVCKRWMNENENFKKTFIIKVHEIKSNIESDNMNEDEKYLLKILNK